MPLVKGKSRRAISTNIETETAAGKPHDQAVAIALSTADRSNEPKRTRKQSALVREMSRHISSKSGRIIRGY